MSEWIYIIKPTHKCKLLQGLIGFVFFIIYIKWIVYFASHLWIFVSNNTSCWYAKNTGSDNICIFILQTTCAAQASSVCLGGVIRGSQWWMMIYYFSTVTTTTTQSLVIPQSSAVIIWRQMALYMESVRCFLINQKCLGTWCFMEFANFI